MVLMAILATVLGIYLNTFRNTPSLFLPVHSGLLYSSPMDQAERNADRKMRPHLSHLNARRYLEITMKTTRFLLPFVHGVDKFAIEQAVLRTKSHNATLVPLVLLYLPEERREKGVRLEYLQQSMDFLETVKQISDWHSVQTEKLEVFTSDVVQSINLVAGEMECEGILLFVSKKGGILLHIEHIKGVMEMPVGKLYITHLPTVEPKSYIQALCLRFSHWLVGKNERRVDQIPGQSILQGKLSFRREFKN